MTGRFESNGENSVANSGCPRSKGHAENFVDCSRNLCVDKNNRLCNSGDVLSFLFFFKLFALVGYFPNLVTLPLLSNKVHKQDRWSFVSLPVHSDTG